MKIAVASADGVAVSPHFGRSACFIVYEVANQKIVSRETRSNEYTAFAKGECRGAEEHTHHDEAHSHAGVVGALRDCVALLCGGMGRRAADELQANGIQPVVVGGDLTPDETVAAYLSGKLKGTTGFCQCHQ